MRIQWWIAVTLFSLSAFAVRAVLRRQMAGLSLPDRPDLHWALIDDPATNAGMVCLSQRDGDALARYFDKIDAFSHAYQRLTR